MCSQSTLFFNINISFYFVNFLFGCARSYLWHVGSSSLTRDGTQASYIGSMESWSLDHQASPTILFICVHFGDEETEAQRDKQLPQSHAVNKSSSRAASLECSEKWHCSIICAMR